MICKKCKTNNVEDAVYCKKCGYRLDGKMKCPSCGSFTAEGKFCNYCGRQMPGTVRCKYCGSVIYDNFVKKEYRGDAGNEVTLGSSGDGVDASSDGEDRDGRRRYKYSKSSETATKTMSIVLAVLGLLAVATVFIFTFFTGMSYTVTESGVKTAESSEYNFILFHFFGKVYSTINASALSETAYSAARTLAVFGTIISACMILAMLGMTVLSVLKITRSLTGKASCGAGKCVTATFFLYVAFCLMLLSLVTRYTEIDGVVTEVTLNGVTYAGISCGAVLTGAYVVGKVVQNRKAVYAKNGLTSLILGILSIGLLVASVALLSGRTTLVKLTDMDSSTYKVGYIADYIYADMPERVGLNYAIVAQFFTFVFIASACLACSGIVTKLTEPDEKSLMPSLYMIAALASAVIVIVFGILGIAENVFDWGTYTEGTFVPLIIGVALFAVSFVLFFVSTRVARNSANPGKTDVDITYGQFAEEDESEDIV
ncbi:MAG: zinc ribbon domain-containing protein [Clostridia bacterium]|nr:zinc ribbon domain-containing protein [Clostridia bacterium]